MTTHYVLIGLLLTIITVSAQTCTGTNLFEFNTDCSSNGFCVADFCSCAPGFSGVDCASNDHTGCTVLDVEPESSNFAVALSASITSGDLTIEIDLPVEDSTSSNRATSTTVEFSVTDTCDYPLSTSWSRSTDENCLETFSFTNSFSNSIGCFSENCYDSLDVPVNCADTESCVDPPCRKEYSTELTISRGYVKENGRVTTEGVDSSTHNITVTYPWVMDVEAATIEIVSVPTVESNFVIESVVFSDNVWLFTIQTSVLYPWKLSAGDNFDFTIDNEATTKDIGLTDVTCALEEGECTQTITISVDGCSTLSEATTFTSFGLQYTCNAATCPNPDTHNASFGFTFDGTNSCDDVTLGVDVELEMNTYDSDLTTSRRSFIFGTTGQPINFKVSVQSQTGDDIAEITLMSITSDYITAPGPYLVTDLATNPNCLPTEACFSIDANDIGGTDDDMEAILDITFTATVEVTFTQGVKRALSFDFYTAETSTTLIQVVEEEKSASMRWVISAFLGLVVLFF